MGYTFWGEWRCGLCHCSLHATCRHIAHLRIYRIDRYCSHSDEYNKENSFDVVNAKYELFSAEEVVMLTHSMCANWDE